MPVQPTQIHYTLLSEVFSVAYVTIAKRLPKASIYTFSLDKNQYKLCLIIPIPPLEKLIIFWCINKAKNDPTF